MDPTLEDLAESLRETPVVDRDGYEYFVHGVSDGIPIVEPAHLAAIADRISSVLDLEDVDKLVTPEAMGIHHTSSLALETGIPFVVVRKRGYGFEDEIDLHQQTGYGESEFTLNGVEAGDRVVLVDDVLATGATIRAVTAALEETGAELVDIVVVLRRTDQDHGELPQSVTSLLEIRVEDGCVVFESDDDLSDGV